ncbi:MAG: hypothetical protein RJA70_986 [Pseudomonadota bacterium]|jgi:hypothetical protein
MPGPREPSRTAFDGVLGALTIEGPTAGERFQLCAGEALSDQLCAAFCLALVWGEIGFSPQGTVFCTAPSNRAGVTVSRVALDIPTLGMKRHWKQQPALKSRCGLVATAIPRLLRMDS